MDRRQRRNGVRHTPMKVCAKPGCPELSKSTYCPAHTPAAWTGSTRRSRLPDDWNKRRARVFARDNHTCRACQGERCGNRNLECDHITPGDNHSLDNLQTLGAVPCHTEKTSAEAAVARRRH